MSGLRDYLAGECDGPGGTKTSRRARKTCIRCGLARDRGPRTRVCSRCIDKPGSAVPAETRAEMRRLREQGLTLRQIAKRTHWSSSAVLSALRVEGADTSRTIHRGSDHHRALTQDDIDQAVELYMSGLSHQQIAERLGLASEWSVRIRLRRAGVDARPVKDAQWLRRLSEVAEGGEAALTPLQRAAFRAVVNAAPDEITTPEIARRIGADVKSVKVTLRRIERMGLVRGQRMTTTKNRPKKWRRTDLAIADVLSAALNERHGADVWLPIEPFRDWLWALVARERRLRVGAVPVSADDLDPTGIVAQRLGMQSRRLYALLRDQRVVSLSVADRALTVSGEPERIEDLWPHLAEGIPDDAGPRFAVAHAERVAA